MNMYQVNFKYITPQKDIRGGNIAIHSEDENTAKKDATKRLLEKHEYFEITSIKQFVKQDAS